MNFPPACRGIRRLVRTKICAARCTFLVVRWFYDMRYYMIEPRHARSVPPIIGYQPDTAGHCTESIPRGLEAGFSVLFLCRYIGTYCSFPFLRLFSSYTPSGCLLGPGPLAFFFLTRKISFGLHDREIGRASCRERGVDLGG